MLTTNVDIAFLAGGGSLVRSPDKTVATRDRVASRAISAT